METLDNSLPLASGEIVRVIRVSRVFGNPVSVFAHTQNGHREKIRVTDWDHINPDTGGLTESGWQFLDLELKKRFGDFEWALG